MAWLKPHALVGLQLQWSLGCERLAGDQVSEAVARPVHPQLVGIHLLRMRGEIRHNDESLATSATDVAEEMHVACLNELCVAMEDRRLLLTQHDEPYQLREVL